MGFNSADYVKFWGVYVVDYVKFWALIVRIM